MDDITHSMNRSRKAPLYTNHQMHAQYNYDYALHDAVEQEYDDEFEGGNDQDSDDNYNASIRYANSLNDDAYNRYPKRHKQMVKSLASDYELIPRNSGGRFYENNLNLESASEWSDHEKFMLLEIWGDRFLQLGRNSLRSEDWSEVAEKVSEMTKVTRVESQCRLVLDGLKRKYRKERAKFGSGEVGSSKWPFFRKMDMLMNQDFAGSGSCGSGNNEFSLACGVDSGEFVFMDTDVYLERANGNDEMRDSPCESEEEGEEEGVSEGNEGVKDLKVLADSVQKFGEIYEKIENSKREQMLELERMRVDFQRELELQKKQILERAQAEIAKIREEDDEGENEDTEDDDGDSTDDASE